MPHVGAAWRAEHVPQLGQLSGNWGNSEGDRTMKATQAILTGVAMLVVTVAAQAQGTPPKTEKVAGAPKVETVTMTGEVVYVSGNWLLCKMQPLGNFTLFDVQPGREFIIDGQTRHIGDLKPGTVLTGTIVTSTTPVTMRTTSMLEGTVLWAQNNYVVLRLDNGEVKEYKVPESYQFNVKGKPATVRELREGMKVSATKIVEEPRTEISSATQITGKAPK